MNPELIGDPAERTGRGRRILPATAIRVARSRSSSGYFFGAAMTHGLPGLMVSIKPGAEHLVHTRESLDLGVRQPSPHVLGVGGPAVGVLGVLEERVHFVVVAVAVAHTFRTARFSSAGGEQVVLPHGPHRRVPPRGAGPNPPPDPIGGLPPRTRRQAIPASPAATPPTDFRARSSDHHEPRIVPTNDRLLTHALAPRVSLEATNTGWLGLDRHLGHRRERPEPRFVRDE